MLANIDSPKVPKLRFPEFKDEWAETNLGKIYPYIRNGFVGTATPFYVKSGHQYVEGKDIKDGRVQDTINVYVSDEFYRRYQNSILKENDFVMVQSGNVGECAVIGSDLEGANSHAIIIMTPSRQVDSQFYKYYFYTDSGKEKIKRIKTGNTVEHILASDMKKMMVYSCSDKEQLKISTFLSKVDDWIEYIKKQKEEWEKYKKGMMQKILSQKIRFNDKNGKEFSNSETRRLNEIGVTYNGLTNKNANDFGTGKPFITYKQIYNNSEINPKKYSLVLVDTLENQNTALFGDILFTTSSETPEEVGFSAVFLDKINKPYLNSFSFGFRPNSLKELNPYYAKFYFRSVIFRLKIWRLAQGSTRYNLSKESFMKLTILLPGFDEQQKIAEFLTSLDKVIESKQKQINLADSWKKGLMQRMFI